MTRPKVCHITTVPVSLKGLLLNQLTALRDAGFEVVAISSPGPEVAALADAQIPHIPITMSRRITPLRDLFALWQLVRVMKREQFTIVHTHNPKPGLLGQLAAKLAGVPIVVNTVHGFYFHDHMKRYAREFYVLMEKIAARCSDRILSQNHDDMETAIIERICRPDQIMHLGNGIDLRRYDRTLYSPAEVATLRKSLAIPEDAKVIGFVGRLTARKGFHHLLAAAAEIAQERPDVRLLIVGSKDSGRSDALGPELIAKHGLSDRCLFVGEQPNERLPLYYLLMDVLTLPSPFEGIPRVVMEASALGIPAVVTNVKGNREAVWEGQNGLLVPFGDPPALAAALLKVIDDPELKRKLGAGGERIARERFDERKVFRTVIAEYRALIARLHPVQDDEAVRRAEAAV